MKRKVSSVLLSFALCTSVCLGCGGKKPAPSKDPWVLSYTTVYAGTEQTFAAGGKASYVFDADLGTDEYLAMDISATVPVRGEITYAYEEDAAVDEDSDTATETFYSLAGTHADVRQILDFFGEYVGNRALRRIDFYNLGDEAGKVTLHTVKVSTLPIDFSTVNFVEAGPLEAQMQLYLQGQSIKLGCTLKSGGAIDWLSDISGAVKQIMRADGTAYVGKTAVAGDIVKANDVNLVNVHDNGRLIQQSYYGIAPDNDQGYQAGEYGAVGEARPWHYNPVQGGNKANQYSRLVDVRVSDTEIYVKSLPRDWAKLYTFSYAYMENWYTLERDETYGEYVKVRNRFTDFSGYDHNNPRAQELPAFYGIAPLGKFVYYGGETPYTGGEVTERPSLAFWDGNRDCRFHATEHWSAWVNEDDWGVGLYVPDVVTTLAGRTAGFTTASPEDNALDIAPSSTYTAPLGNFSLVSFEAFDYTYYMSVGSVADSRALFAKLKAAGAENAYLKGKEVPNWQ